MDQKLNRLSIEDVAEAYLQAYFSVYTPTLPTLTVELGLDQIAEYMYEREATEADYYITDLAEAKGG